jgi:uncharacterized membrane protein YbaN (DUF454 family)
VKLIHFTGDIKVILFALREVSTFCYSKNRQTTDNWLDDNHWILKRVESASEHCSVTCKVKFRINMKGTDVCIFVFENINRTLRQTIDKYIPLLRKTS